VDLADGYLVGRPLVGLADRYLGKGMRMEEKEKERIWRKI
jgi:hypothetical protein